MIIQRTHFFLVLFGILIIPFLTQKIVWLAGSKKVDGIMSFVGKKYAGQMVYTYSVIWFKVGCDTIWFNGRNGILFEEGQRVPVRYQENDPEDARLNMFLAIWGDTLVYAGMPVLVLLIVFLHPQIVPYRSKIRMNTNRPFIEVV